MSEIIYQRVLLKFSGESLKGETTAGVDPEAALRIARQIRDVHAQGVQVGVVIGGGNIFRGLSASRKGMDRVSADNMGMLATTINALALQDALESLGVPTRVQTAIEMRQIAEPFIRRRALRHLEKGRVVIFGAGTGCPFFTTDTSAALRASEIAAQAVLKATKVDGIYSADPETHPDAVRYEKLTYQQALSQNLRVMDPSAFSLCMDNHIPIVVFNFNHENSLNQVLHGDFSIATVVN